MVASIAAGISVDYYLGQVEYYLGTREPDGHWIRVGPGMGLVPYTKVEAEPFTRLHAAQDPTGKSLLANDGHRSKEIGGHDVTFSAPKSVSVLWGLADEGLRAAIEQAQAEAVAAALHLLDKEAGFCRRGHGGSHIEKVSLTVAAFQHGEARPTRHSDDLVFADCALHTHACVLATAQRSDGTFGCLDARPLYFWTKTAGALYHHTLAAQLQRLGFGIEPTGANGIFEVAGVDEQLCAYFSARRSEIVAELATFGLETAQAPALAAAKACATRSSKLDGPQDRHTYWRDRAAALGFAPDRVIDRALQAGLDRAAPRDVADTVPALIDAALHELTERASIFSRHELVAAIASKLVGLPGTHVETELARLAAAGKLVILVRDRWNHPIYSTPAVMRLERELRDCALRLKAQQVAAPSVGRVRTLIDQAGLNAEQAAAAELASGPAVIALIEGGPGVGKTTLLTPVAQSWKEAGWRVIGASNAWKIALQLADDLEIESRAIDSWLARADVGQAFLTDKTVLLIDESGLQSGAQLHRILHAVEAARQKGHRIVVRMCGDRKQLQPIGRPGLQIVADAVGTQRVDTIVRQRQLWMREVVTWFGDGQAREALDTLAAESCIEECQGQAATVRALVAAWDDSRCHHPGRHLLMIAKTNTQVRALNLAARARLRAAHVIGAEEEAVLRAVTPSGKTHELPISRGDRVRFLSRVDRLGVVNGTTATITDIRREGETISIHAQVGTRDVVFTPADLADAAQRVKLAHAYATTCYGAQGLTTEESFVLADVGMDRHTIFVAASRARTRTRLFVDQSQLEARAKQARLLNDRTTPITKDERFAALATAFTRSGIKRSTLDFHEEVRTDPPALTDARILPVGREAQTAAKVEHRPARTRGPALD